MTDLTIEPPIDPDTTEGISNTFDIAGGRVVVTDERLDPNREARAVYAAHWEGRTPAGMPAQLACKMVDGTGSIRLQREISAFTKIERVRAQIGGAPSVLRFVGAVDGRLITERAGANANAVSRAIGDDAGKREVFVERLLRDGLRALEDLSAAGVSSRDLHPGNVMSPYGWKPADGVPERFVVGDFDFAFMPDGEVDTKGETFGQSIVQPPDVASGDRVHQGFYDDIFTLGMTAYILATGTALTPWRNRKDPGTYQPFNVPKLTHPRQWELAPDPYRLTGLPSRLGTVIKMLLAPSYEERRTNLPEIREALGPVAEPVEPTTAELAAPVRQIPSEPAPPPGPETRRPFLAVREDFAPAPRESDQRRVPAWLRMVYAVGRGHLGAGLVSAAVAAAAFFLPEVGVRALADASSFPAPGWVVLLIIVVLGSPVVYLAIGGGPVGGKTHPFGVVVATVAVTGIVGFGTVLVSRGISTQIRADVSGREWSLTRWAPVQWDVVAGIVLWALCAGVVILAVLNFRSSLLRRAPALGLALALFAAGAICLPIGLSQPDVPIAATDKPGSQAVVDCGSLTFTFTVPSNRICVGDDGHWKALTDEQVADDPYVTEQDWDYDVGAGESPGSTYLAVRNQRFSCLTAYVSEHMYPKPSFPSDDYTVSVGLDSAGAELGIPVTRMSSDQLAETTLIAGVPYFVYRGSQGGVDVVQYQAFAPGTDAEDSLNNFYGTTKMSVTFIARQCPGGPLVEQEERGFVDEMRISDTGYLDIPYFQLVGPDLADLDLPLDRLRIPVGSGITALTWNEVQEDLLSGYSAVVGVVSLGEPNGDDFPYAGIRFNLVENVDPTAVVDEDGWQVTDWRPSEDKEGWATRSYFTDVSVDGHTVYVELWLWARPAVDATQSSFFEQVKKLKDGISISKE